MRKKGHATAPRISQNGAPNIVHGATTLEQAERRHWVSYYARMGYTVEQIARAVPFHTKRPVTAAQVRRDLRQTLTILAEETKKNADLIYAEIDDGFATIIEESFRLYAESSQSRQEPVDPLTGKPWELQSNGRTKDGREPRVIPAATYPERAQLLAQAQRALSARSVHRFGAKGGVTVNVDNSQDNRKQILAPQVGAGLDLRAQMMEIQSQIREIEAEATPAPSGRRIPERTQVGLDGQPVGEFQMTLESAGKRATAKEQATRWYEEDEASA